ncbi:MAG: hypothetical protein D6759_10895 [Chloroflexi bacterium]|nr:MAG: hypothetical protein D6759_10895 [Chloroflexota bacterium]
MADLFFAIRLEDVARTTGCEVIWPSIADDVVTIADEEQVALILVDTHTILPWERWVRELKGDPRTAPIPIIAFGASADSKLHQQALAVGCDEVLARSEFVPRLPLLIRRYALTQEE